MFKKDIIFFLSELLTLMLYDTFMISCEDVWDDFGQT